MRKKIGQVLVVTCLLIGTSSAPALAGEEQFARPLWKLTRGITNIAIGFPFEVLKQAFLGLTEDQDYTAGSSLASTASGTVMGIGWGVARVGSGVVDVVTYPYPAPFNDYRPLVEPEFPL